MGIKRSIFVVGLVNTKLLNIDANKVDKWRCCSAGHPLGSWCRIIVTLINVLKQNKAKITAYLYGGGGVSIN